MINKNGEYFIAERWRNVLQEPERVTLKSRVAGTLNGEVEKPVIMTASFGIWRIYDIYLYVVYCFCFVSKRWSKVWMCIVLLSWKMMSKNCTGVWVDSEKFNNGIEDQSFVLEIEKEEQGHKEEEEDVLAAIVAATQKSKLKNAAQLQALDHIRWLHVLTGCSPSFCMQCAVRVWKV